MDNSQISELSQFAAQIRLEIVRMIGKRGFGHLAGSLSVADALAVLYHFVMRYDPKNPQWEDRDLLVMSKGHAGPALYATLALKGFFPMSWLETLNQPGTRLPSHCDRRLTPGVDMTTGSLGQGTSIAAGMALAKKLSRDDNRIFLFVGDGECNEGQVWEAAMFSAQHQLDNMVWFIDYNKKQLDGLLEDVMDILDIRQKFEDFGFDAVEIDGHDPVAIRRAIDQVSDKNGKPGCIVLDTVKGKGISFVECMELNHHLRLSEEEIEKATREAEEGLLALTKEGGHE
ncbi:MAG: transketolase [Eubacteriales bacterium]|nr:transketolase [Eubacteriales bacterium]